jgi:membrane protease YdiL (CAAX protease family)
MVLQIIDFAFEPDFVFQFHFGRWIILFIVSVCLIPFQTSVEEIFMRGYLMQAIGNLTKYPIVGVLLSAGLFGAMHFWNPEVQKMGLPMAVYYYMGFGLVLGAITLLDEGLELALGFHAANNLFASIFVTFKDSSLQTDALVVDSEMNYTRTTILWTVCVCVYLFIVIRKYHFPSIQTLFQKQERMES